MSDIVKYVPKGWGGEKWIANKQEYCLKLLYLIRGKKCSVHFHKIKDETFYIQSGLVRLTYMAPEFWAYDEKKMLTPEYRDMWNVDDTVTTVTLSPGSVFYVPPMMIHEFYGLQDSQIFEVSTQHFDEDSYRIIKGD